jgi:hypothetical protein
MDTDTELDIDIEEQAEIVAAKAIKGFCHAIYFDGQYWGQTYDNYELVYDVIDSDDYPSGEIFDAVCTAACAYIDNNWGGPWTTEEEYAALTGADEPHDEYEEQLELPF